MSKSPEKAKKLLGVQKLDITEIRENVNEVNKLLKSQGVGLDLNMTDIVKKQVKSQLDKLVKEVQSASYGMKSGTKPAADAVHSIAGRIATLTKETERWGAQTKNAVSVVKTGYTSAGQAIKEVWKNGQQASSTVISTDKISAANELYKRQSAALKELYELKKRMAGSTGGSESSSLNEELRKTQEIVDANRQTISGYDAKIIRQTSLNKLVEEEQKLKERLAKVQQKSGTQVEAEYVKQAKQAYQQLTESYLSYNKAVSNGSEASAQYWNQSAQDALNTMRRLKDVVPTLGEESAARKQIVSLIEKAKVAQDAQTRATQQQGDAVRKYAQTADRVVGRMIQMAGTMLVMRGLSSLWNNAKEYAQTYYDKLNEIRIVTMQTEEYANHLGESYRSMARDMKVSSTEIASAATEFWRQGLDESEVNARQVAATKYAKVSSLGFEQSAKIVTAASNAMEISAEHAIDVFTYLGDASASGADEVGIAMQKASASAKEFGLSFEWLGAYIATMSEKTRQAPEVIGTSLNALMARLHSIKKTGYNEEDETKLNDIAKALETINVRLLDNEGDWRAMSDIFDDIASKWDTMTTKQRAYISTTLAGTRQQNYFLTLMGDMAQGAEGGSRAYELYAGAINSAGIATEKYAIWQESVAAAQNNLSTAMEEMYSLLSADWMKGFYNDMAAIVRIFVEATDAMNGMNVTLPAVIVGVTGLTSAIVKAGGLKAAITGLLSVLSAHPVALAITAFVGLSAVITTVSSQMIQKTVDIGKSLDSIKGKLDEAKAAQREWTNRSNEIETLRSKYIKLATNANRTKEDNEELKKVLSDIVGVCPSLKTVVGEVSDSYALQTGVVAELNAQLRENYDLQTASARIKARESFGEIATTVREADRRERDLADKQKYIQELREYTKGKDKESLGIEDVKDFILKKMETDGATYAKLAEFTNTFGASHPLVVGKVKSVIDVAEKMRNAYGTVDDELTVASAQEEAAINQMREALLLFADTSKLSPVYRQYAEAIIDEMIAGIDIGARDLEEQMNNVATMLADKTADILSEQQSVENDPMKKALMNHLDKAYNEVLSQKNTESLDAYNALVDEWNTTFGSEGFAKFERMDESFLQSLEQTSGSADEVADSLKNARTAMEEYKKAADRRVEKQGAETSGFETQLRKLRSSLGADGTDLESFRAYMDHLKESNEDLYLSMVETYGDMKAIYDGEFIEIDPETGKEAGKKNLLALDAMLEESRKVADEYAERYANIVGNIQAPKGNEGFSDAIRMLKESLIAGGEDTGAGSMLSQLDAMSNDTVAKLMEIMPWLATLKEETHSYSELLSMINEQIEGTSENWTAYLEQLASLGEADTSQMTEFFERMQGIDGEEGIQAFADAWDALDKEAIDAIRSIMEEEEEQIDAVLSGGEAAEDALGDVSQKLKKLNIKKLEETGKVLEGTSDAFESVGKGGTKFASAYGDMTKKTKSLSTAQSALNYILSDGQKDTESLSSALDEVASYAGIARDELENNLAPAEAMIAEQTTMTANTISAQAEQMYAMAGIQFDASGWRAQLASLAADSTSTEGQLAILVSRLLQLSGSSLYLDGNTVKVKWGSANSYTPKVSSGGKRSGGGGSKGSGSDLSASKEISEIEKMLDLMAQVQEIQEHVRSMAQMTQSQNDAQGYTTGVIQGMNDEIGAIQKNSMTLEENKSRLEGSIEAKKKELAGLSQGTDAYKEASDELKDLQDRHREYSKELVQNQVDVIELEKKVKEAYDSIRQKEIDLRNLILEAIEDREEKQERMLQGTIDVENEIMDILTARYEKERDEILETSQAKIDALEQEKDLIDEQLQARKKANEEEDKHKKLLELEAKLSRISADPTRKKEQLSILQQINELREEMAWDLAEKEADAQKESLEQQITSVEDYMEYVESYYEELFNNPRKLIEEMNALMQKTDAEILAWLKENSEEFSNSTDATQKDMVNSWQSMLDDMNGAIVVHWDEVEAIIAQGDEAIIQFLKENSADYQAAGRLQAEAYVDQWKQQLQDLRNAYKAVADEISSYNYVAVSPSNGGSSDSGSGGGGGTSGGGYKAYSAKYGYRVKGGSYTTVSQTSAKSQKDAEEKAFTKTKEMALDYWRRNDSSQGRVVQAIAAANINSLGSYLKKYKKGGLVDFTGPAWVDGSKTNPEAFLNPLQTKLVGQLAKALEQMKVHVPAMPSFAAQAQGNQDNGVRVNGDLIVQVEKLANQEDVDKMIATLKQAFYKDQTRGVAVGGLRMG